MRPLIGEAMRAKGADLVADNRDLTTHSAAQDLMHETDRIGVLSRVLSELRGEWQDFGELQDTAAVGHS